MKEFWKKPFDQWPYVKELFSFLKKIKLPGFEGLSIYTLLELYTIGIMRGALSSRASSIAFSLFMALFPLLIFLITLFPYLIPLIKLENQDFDLQFLLFLESFLPDATSEYFGDIYAQLKDQKKGGILSSSFMLSIFLVANGVNAIFSGFEYSYHVALSRNFLKQYAYALMVGLILSLLVIISAITFFYVEFYFVKQATNYFTDLGVNEEYQINFWDMLAKNFFFAGLTYFAISLLYFFGTVEGRKIRFFSPGALMTTVLFYFTSWGFGVYVEKFASYNELYGALGGLLILMLFIWLNSNVLLLGFELNASLTSLKRSTQKSTTT